LAQRINITWLLVAKYAFGFAIGFFLGLIAEVALVLPLEAWAGEKFGPRGWAAAVVPAAIGVVVMRWFGALDLTAELKRLKKARRKRPWDFTLMGTLALFWFLSLLGIVVLFGPFGFADNPAVWVQLMKMVAMTVAIVGLAAYLLYRSYRRLQKRRPQGSPP
jgi:uncharacterized sodium:solute symporter family permease YidK